MFANVSSWHDLFDNHRFIGFSWEQHALPHFTQHFESMLLICHFYLLTVLFQPKLKLKMVGPIERIWNLTCSVFSLAGFVGIMIGMNAVHFDLQEFIQHPGCAGVWMFLYTFTKPLEFIDTWLLMAKQKPITTLHFSHHFLTALFAWYATRNFEDMHVIFATTNLFVHFVMYAYYFLTSFPACKRAVMKYGYLVTIIQLIQFVFCLGYICWVFVRDGYHSGHFPAVALYVYYFVMFWQFYRGRHHQKNVSQEI